jgi:hypothetical protein
MASLDAAFAPTSLLEDNAMILLCLAAGACQAAGTLALIYYSTLEYRKKRTSTATRGGLGKERRPRKSNRTELVDSQAPSVLSGEDSMEFFETMGRDLEQTEGVRLLLAALRRTSEASCRRTSQEA